jgi:hypothetical protein
MGAGLDPNIAQDYLNEAVAVAAKLEERLSSSNAPDHLLTAIEALEQVLGTRIGSLQPDRLRRAARRIAAIATTYAHAQMEWEISGESVSDFLELNGLLEDLQAFYPAAIAANVAEIRRLALTAAEAPALRRAADEVVDVVAAADGAVTERVVEVLAADRSLEPAETEAIDPDAEAERGIVTANLLNAAARETARLAQSNSLTPDDTPEPAPEAAAGADGTPPKKPRRRSPGRKTSQPTWSEVVTKTLERFKGKLPEAVGDKAADAVAKLVATSIETAPVNILNLASALYGLVMDHPSLLAISGVSASIAWIGHNLKTLAENRPPPDDATDV